MDNIILIIPTLEPEDDFIKIIKNYKSVFINIVVVNDGSDQKYDHIFEKVKETGVIVLTHALNYGKGRALKTAFNFVILNYKEAIGVITVDSDGQHLLKDIKKCAETFMNCSNKLVLGTRNFEQDNIPFKSKLGNKLTRNIFKLLCGINLKDSQTGLRGISIKNIKRFLYTNGEKFEYETNMLLDSKKYGIDFEEVPIQTIYLNGNRSTHFNPVKDSIQIYKSFVKYLVVSTSSFILDISGFILFLKIFNIFLSGIYQISFAVVLSRILSSIYNYFFNSRIFFNNEKFKYSIIKYYILVIIQMCVSSVLLTLLSRLFGNEFIVLLKLFIDIIIFVVNYYIQREWVFSKGKS